MTIVKVRGFQPSYLPGDIDSERYVTNEGQVRANTPPGPLVRIAGTDYYVSVSEIESATRFSENRYNVVLKDGRTGQARGENLHVQLAGLY